MYAQRKKSQNAFVVLIFFLAMSCAGMIRSWDRSCISLWPTNVFVFSVLFSLEMSFLSLFFFSFTCVLCFLCCFPSFFSHSSTRESEHQRYFVSFFMLYLFFSCLFKRDNFISIRKYMTEININSETERKETRKNIFMTCSDNFLFILVFINSSPSLNYFYFTFHSYISNNKALL